MSEKETNNTSKLSNNNENKSSGKKFNILLLVAILLIIVMLFRVSVGAGVPTFVSLLEKFTTASVPTIPFVNSDTVILGDWGSLLNPLRDFVRLLLDIFNVVLFFCNGLISAITYIIWFIQWIFFV